MARSSKIGSSMWKRVGLVALLMLVIGETLYLVHLIGEVKRLKERMSAPVPRREMDGLNKAKIAKQSVSNYGWFQEIEGWISEWKPKATDETIAKYKRALEDKPGDAEVYFVLGRVYLCFPDKWDNTNFYFKRMLELSPKHPQEKTIHLWLKWYEENRKQSLVEKEIDEQQKELAKGRGSAQEYLKMARIYKKYSMFLPAYAWYKKCAELSENADLVFEAACFLKSDYYEEAVKYFRKVLELERKHPQKAEIQGYIKSLEVKLHKQRFIYEKGNVFERDLLSSLEAQVSDESIVQKRFAIERLSKIKSESAVVMLCTCIGQKEIQREAIAGLLKIGTDLARRKLEELLYDTSASSMKIVDTLLAYSQSGSKEDVVVLQKWIESPAAVKYKHQGEWAVKEIQKRLQR